MPSGYTALTADGSGDASVDLECQPGRRYVFRFWTAANAGTVTLKDTAPGGTAYPLPKTSDPADGEAIWDTSIENHGGAVIAATSPTLSIVCAGFAENDVINYLFCEAKF